MADQDPGDRTAKAQHRAQVGAVAVIAAVGIGALVLLNGGDDEPRRINPSAICHELVRQKLSNPATADFQASRTTTTSTRITGVVQAENDFGVTQELDYTCSIDGDTVTGASVSQ